MSDGNVSKSTHHTVDLFMTKRKMNEVSRCAHEVPLSDKGQSSSVTHKEMGVSMCTAVQHREVTPNPIVSFWQLSVFHTQAKQQML